MNERTPNTEQERGAIMALKRCGFAPCSWDKRFVGMLQLDTMTAKERPQMWRLVIRYRRQITNNRVHGITNKLKRYEATCEVVNLLHVAAQNAAPDFRKRVLTTDGHGLTQIKNL